MVSAFSVLEKTHIPIGKGAIICCKESFTALDSETLIVNVGMI